MKRLLLLLPVLLVACESNSPTGLSPLDDAARTSSTPKPSLPCTTVCYVNGASGNDAGNGDTPATAKKSIQAALNQVSSGGEVHVFPGTYNESAPGSTVTGIPGGVYQFGLYFSKSKPGITLLGVNSADKPVRKVKDIEVTINTNATNDFGEDGIFVDADNTTIQGVRIGPNATQDNKTIEVVADNFTLQFCETAIFHGGQPYGGSIYIDDFTADGTRVKSYHILSNNFPDATSIDISSGAGLTGSLKNREIRENSFDLGSYDWNAISFNGSGTGVPWFVNSVGGASIRSNNFKGGSLQYVRARGSYDNSQFDWKGYFNENQYDQAAVLLTDKSAFDVRAYSYTSDSYVFTNVRRIGISIATETPHALPGDVISVKH